MSFITNQLSGNITATGNLLPSSNTVSLGSATQGWANIYVASGQIASVTPTISVIFGLILDLIVTYSINPTDKLDIGQYGLTNGISAPYTVLTFTTVPNPALQIGDIVTGTNIPPNSEILFVGSGGYNNLIIIGQTVHGNVPSYGTQLSFTRSTVSAAMAIFTQPNTDIQLATGAGGQIVAHGNLYPYTDNVYDIGQRLRRINDVWLGGNLYMTDQTLGYTNILNANNGSFNILGTTGLTVGEFIFSGSNLAVQQSSVDINIGNSSDTGLVQFNRGIAVTNTITNTDTFSVTRQGLVTVLTPKTLLTTESALSIIGTSSGQQQPRNFTGTLLQLTAQDGQPARVSIDAFGANAYPVIAGRQAEGTVYAPTATLNGDTLMRMSGQGYGTTAYVGAIARINLQAAQNFTDSNAGTRIRFQTTPINSNVIQTVTADFTPTGLSFVGNPTGGITFPDSTYQTTAWLGTTPAGNITGLSSVATSGSYNDLSNKPTISAVGYSGNFSDLLAVPPIVNTITVGTGLSQTGTSGDIGINATGVANVTAAAGYGGITVTDLGGKNLVLALPQPLATNSQVSFGNLTISGNLTVNGTFTATYNSSVENKVLNLANNVTSGSQIDGGGIVLGQDGFSVNFLYNLANNYWDTDGAGLNTLQLYAENTSVNFLNVATQQHIGLAYSGYDYPSSPLQIDSNFNSYSQIVSVNHSIGTNASTDFVATSNLGNDQINYIDMGINGGSFSNPSWTINGANDGYLYVDAGNLAIGTDTPGTTLVFFTGGTLAANSAGYISSGGRWVLGASDDKVTKLQVGGNASFTGNVIARSANVTNVIAAGTVVVGGSVPGAFANANLQIFGNQNQSIQVLAQNTNDGSGARTDFVAVANNGSASSNYIDMGINSNTYSQAGYTAQYPNDGYLFTSNGNLVISTQSSGKKVVFTTDGTNINNIAGFVTGQRWILGATDDGHSKLQLSGNIAVTGNIIATQTITAGTLLTTSAGTSGDLTVAGTARLNGIVASGTVQAVGAVVANTLTSNTSITSQTLNVISAAQVNSMTTNLLTTTQTLNVPGLAIFNSVQSNGVITTNGLQSSAQATVATLVSNGAIQGTSAFVTALTTTSIQNSGMTLVQSLNSNTNVVATNLQSTGQTSVASLVSNGSITGTTIYSTAVTATSIQNSGTTTVQSLSSNTSVVATNLQSTGTATVNALISNGSITGTSATITSLQASSSATVNSLISNGSIFGTTINATGITATSLQNSGGTLVQSLNSNSGIYASTLQSSGTATVNALASNGAITGTTINATGITATSLQNSGSALVQSLFSNSSIFATTLQLGSQALVNSLISNGAISGTTATVTSLQSSGAATVNALTSNGAITGTTINGTSVTVTSLQNSGATLVQSLNSNSSVTAVNLQSSGAATVASLISNGIIQGTTTFVTALQNSGIAIVNSLTSNGAISGTTATVTSLQSSGIATVNTLNSNVSGYFGQNVLIASTNTSISTSTGALTVAGGIGVAGNINSGGQIVDVNGNVRSLPVTNKTSGYTLTPADNGNIVSITTGNVTVPGNVFVSPFGQVITIFNNNTSPQFVIQGAGVTMHWAGTANTGNRALAQYGLATVVAISANVFVISGAGIT